MALAVSGIWIFLTVFSFMAAVLILSYFFSKRAIILREMAKSKAKPIGSIREGEYVKVVGKAKHAKEPLIAPISERPCIFYHVEVLNTGGKNDKTLIDEMKAQDFFLEQNGEIVMVKQDQAYSFRKVYLVQDHQKNSGSFQGADPHLEKYLKKHHESSKNWLGFNKQLKYKEGIIALEEEIAVKGIAQWKSLKQPIEGYPYSKILSLRGSEDKKLLITDHKKALKDSKQ